MFLKKLFDVVAKYDDLQKQVEHLEYLLEKVSRQNAIIDPDPYYHDKSLEIARRALEKSELVEHELRSSDRDLSIIYADLQSIRLKQIDLSHAETSNGEEFIISIYLENASETSNVTVILESDNPDFVIPKFITIPKKQKFMNAIVKCNSKVVNEHITISASLNNITKLEMIKVVD